MNERKMFQKIMWLRESNWSLTFCQLDIHLRTEREMKQRREGGRQISLMTNKVKELFPNKSVPHCKLFIDWFYKVIQLHFHFEVSGTRVNLLTLKYLPKTSKLLTTSKQLSFTAKNASRISGSSMKFFEYCWRTFRGSKRNKYSTMHTWNS